MCFGGRIGAEHPEEHREDRGGGGGWVCFLGHRLSLQDGLWGALGTSVLAHSLSPQSQPTVPACREPPQVRASVNEVLSTQCGFSSWEAAWEHIVFWR